MTDLEKYLLKTAGEKFAETVDQLTMDAIRTMGPSPEAIAEITHALFSIALHLMITTNADEDVFDVRNREVVRRLSQELGFKFCLLIIKKINPKSWEQFVAHEPDRIKGLENVDL